VLVTYNREKFLPRTLNCILDQTYTNFELLICDDSSTDNTETICREYARYDQRIRYHRNRANLGMPGNLNHGIRRARFEFVANLHDGDIYHPTLLEKWRDALIENPTAGFVFNIYRHLFPHGHSGALTSEFPSLLNGHHFLENVCFKDRELECPVWGTVMARRSVYEAVGHFDDTYTFWSDFDMWFRIAEQYDVASCRRR
jgi:glycosyltransferase involved in cell wall biosynthesis